LGHPLLGDPIYGAGDGKLMLLARSIRLNLDPPVEAVAAIPAHMKACLTVLGF
jgi:23S rRNA-/tRNA-specific pseudouridylate synthase